MKIKLASLLAPQAYQMQRRAHRQAQIRHRRARCVSLGPWMRLQFEDEATVRYQIQEMLHTERQHGAEAARREIETYAHLVPDGTNWKATLLLELLEADERRRALPGLNEAAHRLYVELDGHCRIFAHANEDQPDRHLGRPSGVHFLRFELPDELRRALLDGAPAWLGCADDRYAFRRLLPPPLLERLCADLHPGVASRPMETADVPG